MWSNSIKFLVVMLCALSLKAHALSDSVLVTKQLLTDSSVITVRCADSAKQHSLLSNKDYMYNRDQAASKSWWDKFWDWFYEKMGDIFETNSGQIGWKIIKYVFITLAIAVVIFLLFKGNVRALFYGKSASVEIDFRELNEDIHAIDFVTLIQQSLNEKDYRRAVRLHFLRLLKELTDKNLIAWKIDKTNNDYSIELLNTQYSKPFREAVLLYEFVWYGNFSLDEQEYLTTIEKFKTFEI